MTPSKIIVHHSACADRPGLDWSGIRDYHKRVLGYIDVAYHCGVELVGGGYEALYGRPLDRQGAHAFGNNYGSLGICLVGDFTTEPPPTAQLEKAAEVVRLWMRLYGITITHVVRHSDVNATACPGAAFPWDEFISLIKEGL